MARMGEKRVHIWSSWGNRTELDYWGDIGIDEWIIVSTSPLYRAMPTFDTFIKFICSSDDNCLVIFYNSDLCTPIVATGET